MFVPFKINRHLIATRLRWATVVQETPKRQQGRLMDVLHRTRAGGVPNFTQSGRGQTLREWAREHGASYTLGLEIVHA